MKNMFEGYQNTEELTHNLKDAGCSETMITCFLSCMFSGDKTGGLKRLEERRSELLHEIHEDQRCIELLDEQLYSLRRISS
ncbi:MAG: hypothetical protein J1F41_11645 [Lachnospiraceae bacterium]|nr:hypothetical protein [Lachnospiraceae bacterium]